MICHLVLEDVSEWNINYLNEKQVFEKPDYGVKFVIPPLSMKVGQEITIKFKVVAPEESEIILPSDVDVELISCLYKIEITGKFSRPIELHLQHNVEITSEEESQELAFIKAKGSPPYKFELVPNDMNQVFKPYDNFGVIETFDFCVLAEGIRKRKRKDDSLSSSYAMTVFVRHTFNFSWVMQAVITKNLGPYLKVFS